MRNVEVGRYGASYSDLIESFEVENLIQVDDNDYQGDTRVLLRDGQRYGILTFGWGSCSGCDSLEAAGDNHAEVTELRDELWRGIHWEDSAAALFAYIDGKDWSLDFGYNDEKKQFLAQARDLLATVSA